MIAWMRSFSDSMLSEWLWSVTWGWYHIPVVIFTMIFLLIFFGQMRIMPSVLISVFSQLFACASFTALTLFFPIYLLNRSFVCYDCYATSALHPAFTCLILGVIYFFFSLLFFYGLNFFYTIDLRLVALISFASHVVTALLVYRFWCFDVL